ncbi:hypothetical protein HDR66_01935 [bacterium]|nr:hypothetical protein [bacterium]
MKQSDCKINFIPAPQWAEKQKPAKAGFDSWQPQPDSLGTMCLRGIRDGSPAFYLAYLLIVELVRSHPIWAKIKTGKSRF